MNTTYENFLNKIKIDLTTGCWDWQGSLNWQGYGKFRMNGTVSTPHRWSYEYFTGKGVASDRHVDHLCRNRRCVNYLHLEVVTPAENNRRGIIACATPQETHCPYGHAYEGNAYFGKTGGRTCIKCAKKRNKLNKQRLREQKALGIEPIKQDTTHCKRGHLRTEENTYVKPSTGAKECRLCNNTSKKRSYYKQRGIA